MDTFETISGQIWDNFEATLGQEQGDQEQGDDGLTSGGTCWPPARVSLAAAHYFHASEDNTHHHHHHHHHHHIH